MNLLGIIGKALNADVYPIVMEGGIFKMPDDPNPSPTNQGMEMVDGYSSRRSETRSRERPSSWEGPTRGSWSSSTTTPVVCSDVRSIYEQDLMLVEQAYPDSRQWLFEDHMWLLTKSQLLEGCQHPASFLTGVTFTLPVRVRAWGFWDGAIPIGPKHTNCPDGSICAFNPTDGSWIGGESLVPLLDMYSLWALRHLHLKQFGYWPGRQHCFSRYERYIEVQNRELCGCGSDVPYVDCCKSSDLTMPLLQEAIKFISLTNHGFRETPNSLKQFMLDPTNPPPKSLLNN